MSPRQIVESSSKKRSKSRPEKPEKSSRAKDETAEEREARREERRRKKEEREARKAAEAAAFLGISRVKKTKAGKDKGKGKEKEEPKREKKSKAVAASDQAGKPAVAVKKSESPRREVRPIHLASGSHRRDSSLSNVKDSSTETQRSARRHHHHHEHSSLESADACERCIRRRRKKEERGDVEGEGESLERGWGQGWGWFEGTDRRGRGEQNAREVDGRDGRSRSKVVTTESILSRQSERVPSRRAEKLYGRETALPRSPAERGMSRPPPTVRAAERPVERSTSRPPERRTERAAGRSHRSQRASEVSVRSVERTAERTLLRTTQRIVERPQPIARAPSSRESEHVMRERGRASARTESSRQPQRTSSQQRPLQRPVLGFEIEKKPEKLITCITCLDDEVLSKEAAKLPCEHWFCNECLKRIFILSLTDPAHMPPKCCSSDHIPLKHVDKLLTYKEKKQWNTKYLEYTTANRIYCPTTDCGEWIQPKDIRDGIGKCQKCKNKVCATCNGPAHGNGECPQDPEVLKFLETAEKHKYQQCYNCRAMVELERGCNHMTCHCTAQFCYVCGSKWKSCACPWFNYEPGDADREYVVPDWNAREPVFPAAEHNRNNREQVREDEAMARQLAREINPLEAAPAARDYPLDALAALGTLGLGLRNGIRRLAAAAADPAPARPRSEPEPEPEPRHRRQNAHHGPLNTGPGLGLGLARTGAPPFYGARTAAAPAEAHIPAEEGFRSNFLTNSQQNHIERYLANVDLEDAEPAVESPFRQEEGRGGDEGEEQRPAPDRRSTEPPPARRSNTSAAPPPPPPPRRSTTESRARRRETDDGGGGRGLSLAGLGLRTLDMPRMEQLVVGGGGERRRR